jgi:hypothetical protein
MARASEPRDLDERIGWIKESITSRVDELGRRVDKVRSLTDVVQLVRQHPLAAVGVSFAAGLILAIPSRPKQIGPGAPQHEGILRAGLRTVVMSMVAQYARNAARRWMDDLHQERRAAAHGVAEMPNTRDVRDIH